MKVWTRKGFLIEEQGMSYLDDRDPDRALGPLRAATCTYRIALRPRAGQKARHRDGACLARRGRSARLRPEIIPSSGRPAGDAPSFGCQTGTLPVPGIPVPGFPTVPVNAPTPSADPAEALPPAAPARLSWARLLKRVFEMDLEHAPIAAAP